MSNHRVPINDELNWNEDKIEIFGECLTIDATEDVIVKYLTLEATQDATIERLTIEDTQFSLSWLRR